MIQQDEPSSIAAPLSRRKVLAAMGTALTATTVAGCTGADRAQGQPPERTETTPAPTTASPRAILAAAPFAPQDIDRFLPEIYPDAAVAPAARFTRVEPDEILATLEATLRRRFLEAPEGERRVREAMALVDDSALAETVRDVRLRAAMVNLTGTVGEPALEAFLAGTYDDVGFGYIRDPWTFAQVTITDYRTDVDFNSRYQHEDFRLLTSTMAHEALHQDEHVNIVEEVLCDSVDTLVFAQLLLATPELALGETFLPRLHNTNLFARLNSRDETGHMTIRGGKGALFPNADFGHLRGFGEYRAISRGEENYENWRSNPGQPGDETLDGVVSAIVGREESGLDYDETTLNLLDEQVVLTPDEQLRLFEILSVRTDDPREPAPTTGG